MLYLFSLEIVSILLPNLFLYVILNTNKTLCVLIVQKSLSIFALHDCKFSGIFQYLYLFTSFQIKLLMGEKMD